MQKNHAEIGYYPNVSPESCGLTAVYRSGASVGTVGPEKRVNNEFVNEMNASIGEFPWMASVVTTFDDQSFMYCGGAIINQLWILTVADCFYNRLYLILSFNIYHIYCTV